MKKLRYAVPLALTLGVAGCTTADQNNAVLGGAAGAAIGGVATGSLEGAAVGAAVGAGAGVLIGRIAGTPNCRYRDQYGREYVAPCR